MWLVHGPHFERPGSRKHHCELIRAMVLIVCRGQGKGRTFYLYEVKTGLGYVGWSRVFMKEENGMSAQGI